MSAAYLRDDLDGASSAVKRLSFVSSDSIAGR